MSRNRMQLVRTRQEAEEMMGALAATANERRQLLAERDAEVLRINERYEAQLAGCEVVLSGYTEQLKVWAEANPEEFPKGRKSMELAAGVLGFRTGTPRLALLSRAWTWQKVLDVLMGKFGGWCVRTKLEVDKEAVLAERETAPLEAMGLKVVQEESFFVEPKLAEMEGRITDKG